jgi:hypothetical protein
MAYHWSPSRLSFYPTEMRTDYEAAGSWPGDAVEVADSVFADFSGSPPAGKLRGAGANGLPAWVDPPPPTKTGRLADLAAYRFARETAGIYFKASAALTPSPYATDRDAQSKIIGASVRAAAGKLPGVLWKCMDGSFVPLTAADVIALADAAVTYVATCYAHEGALAAQIEAGGTPDITAGWPSQGNLS